MKKKSLIISSSLLGIAASASMALADVNQPQEIIDRPRTTPGGQITVGGDLLFPINPDAFSTLGLNVGGLYGVDDKLEVGASYDFALKDFEAKGDFEVTGAYSILQGNLSVAADVGLGYNILAEGVDPITLGAEVQFKINDQLAVFSPGHQVSIGIEDGSTSFINVPVGVGFQAAPAIFASVQTSIMTIPLSDGETAIFGADYIPLAVSGFFSPSNTMDIGASVVWLDLKEFSDVVGGAVHFRLHM